MTYTVRRVRADEWESVRATRLASLADPLAHLAFLQTYEHAAAQDDDVWKQRAVNAAAGEAVCTQAIVEPGGTWVGCATGVREKAGEPDYAGLPVDQEQVHVVGVWLHPDHRGQGLVQEAVDNLVEWARGQGVQRVRLNVHADNARAQAAYVKAGFTPSGKRHEGPIGPEIEMVRDLS